jgi:hypothetical protein
VRSQRGCLNESRALARACTGVGQDYCHLVCKVEQLTRKIDKFEVSSSKFDVNLSIFEMKRSKFEVNTLVIYNNAKFGRRCI